VPIDTIIIPKSRYYVKKSLILTEISLFGICVQKAPDFIYCGAAVFLKMGSHDVRCAANRFLCLRWRMLQSGISHGIISLSFLC